jgi:hypothetical protein
MPRFYFAEFVNKEERVVFQKFGHTSFSDAQDRLDRITSEYPQFEARVLASAFHKDLAKCQGAEMAFQAMYPKNFWLEEKLSGITECVMLNYDIRNEVIAAVRKLNEKFKKECFPNENSTRSA